MKFLDKQEKAQSDPAAYAASRCLAALDSGAESSGNYLSRLRPAQIGLGPATVDVSGERVVDSMVDAGERAIRWH